MKFVLFIFLYVASPDSNVQPMILSKPFDTMAQCEAAKEEALKKPLELPMKGAATCISENELLGLKIS